MICNLVVFSLFYGSVFKNLANPSHMYFTSAMMNSRTKEGFFLKNVVKLFFSRLRNFCFTVYFYLFVKFSGLFLPTTLTRTRDVYPHPHPRHLGILIKYEKSFVPRHMKCDEGLF